MELDFKDQDAVEAEKGEHYMVKVTVTYPVNALNAEAALETVPLVIRIKYADGLVEALAEIISNGEVVLKAKLGGQK